MKRLTVFIVLTMVVLAALVVGCERQNTLAATPTPRLDEPDAQGMIAAHAPFTKVEMNGSLDLKLTIAEGEARYKLEGDKQRMGYVDIAIVEGVLIVKERPAHVAVMMGKVTVIVHAPRIEAVTLNGSGNAELQGKFGGALSLVIDGSSNVDFAGEAVALQVTINGSGDIQARGRANAFTVKIAGSGNIKAREMQSESASVVIDGAGRTELTVTRSLHATIMGTGAIVYYGNPATVDKQVMGAGSITAGE
ncbi:MAG TPA: head GIN domain-containing protein [bacterium]|nr:head GIN domain-containing protein [bacterium]